MENDLEVGKNEKEESYMKFEKMRRSICSA